MNGHAVKAPRIHYAKKELNIIFEENILLPLIENNNLADALANLFFYYFIFDLQYPKNFVQCLNVFCSMFCSMLMFCSSINMLINLCAVLRL